VTDGSNLLTSVDQQGLGNLTVQSATVAATEPENSDADMDTSSSAGADHAETHDWPAESNMSIEDESAKADNLQPMETNSGDALDLSLSSPLKKVDGDRVGDNAITGTSGTSGAAVHTEWSQELLGNNTAEELYRATQSTLSDTDIV
jgi:hypothetical protein